MIIRTFAAAIALTLGAASAQADNGQIAAGLGLDPAEASRLSLTEIVVMKRNAETRGDDRSNIPVAAHAGDAARSQLAHAAGVTPAEAAEMTLSELVAVKAFREARGDDKVSPQPNREPASANAQFVASAGLSPDVARSQSFHEIYLAKIRRQSNDD